MQQVAGLSPLADSNYGWHSVLLAGAIAPLALTILTVLFLPESVKYLVHRGKEIAQVKRIARRFMP